MKVMMKYPGLSFVVLLAVSCGNGYGGTVQDPCEGAACSGHGTCFVAGHEPFCDCDDGYHPEILACAANDTTDPCLEVECNGHGSCRVEEGNPVCICDPGFIHPPETDLLCFLDPHRDAYTEGDMEEDGEVIDSIDAVDTEGIEDEDLSPLCGNSEIDDGEECDDGRNGDPDDGCTDACRYSCHSHAECDDGLGCTDDACNPATHTCANTTSLPDRLCRPAAEACDMPEYCDGESDECPADEMSCWTHVSGHINHTCAVTNESTLYCWGNNQHGQLGDGTTEEKTFPVRLGEDSDWTSISAGGGHTCAVKQNHSLFCWGGNTFGQVGDGTTDDRHEPVRIGTGTDWAAVSCGTHHTCAMKTDDRIYCWGWNGSGQLGDGTTLFHEQPELVSASWYWSVIDVGFNHSCGINNLQNTAYCWGANGSGQIGDSTTDNRSSPEAVAHFSEPILISGGQSHTCSIKANHTLFCWGNNGAGRLGNGVTGGHRTTPNQVGTDMIWTSVDAGGRHTCAIQSGNVLFCWGLNDEGQLGDGSLIDTNVPNQVGTETVWDKVSAGDQHTCAIKTDGRLFCWGSNTFGQLGDGSWTNQRYPTLITRI